MDSPVNKVEPPTGTNSDPRREKPRQHEPGKRQRKEEEEEEAPETEESPLVLYDRRGNIVWRS